jgi:hypothetical protein
VIDLFGCEIAEPSEAKRKPTVKRGYAARPGTGPEGEFCNTCAHYTIKRMGSQYRKCGLMRRVWTSGSGTDILASSPACEKWESTRCQSTKDMLEAVSE